MCLVTKEKGYILGKHFAELAGINIQTLKNWAECGLLEPVATTECGWRYYTRDQLKDVARIIEETNKNKEKKYHIRKYNKEILNIR